MRPALVLLPLLAFAGAARAQIAPPGGGDPSGAPPASVIIPDAGAGRSLGTTVNPAGNVYVIDGGTRAGANLFHSFAQFDLAQGNTARFAYSFGNAASIANVISRVTGGTPSHIEGIIDSSALPNADFWFINPAGILFGAGAQFDVPAAAHFSTAQELRFQSGPAFSVTTPGGSTLSVAPPAAFGFLGGQGAIVLDSVGRDVPFLPNEGRIDFTAGDVSIRDTGIDANGFRLVAVGAGPAEAAVAGPPPSQGGSVDIGSSTLHLTGTAAGSAGIAIGGATVSVTHSDLGTSFSNLGPASGVGGPIVIRGDDITIFSSLVSASTYGAERAGDIEIAGRNVAIGGGSVVETETREGSTGAGGKLSISGEIVRIDERTVVTSSTQTAAPAGDLSITADRIVMDDALILSSALPAATGPGGTIRISGGDLDMSVSAVTSQTLGAGDAGIIRIEMSRHVVLRTSSIDSRSDPPSFGDAALTGAGAGGQVFITTPSLELREGASITTATFGSGAAGLISIDANFVRLADSSSILTNSNPFATGPGGRIEIGGAGQLALSGGSSIQSDASGAGDAGSIAIRMGEVELDGSTISAASEAGSTGRSGALSIEAGAIRVSGGSSIETISRNLNPAGDISIAADSLLVGGAGSRISSANEFADGGDAGTASIAARLVTLSEGGMISTSSAAGAAGDISLFMPGDGLLTLEGRETPSLITTSSGPGTGGRIAIASPRAIISNGGSILALGEQGGANVRIQTRFFINSADRANRVAVNGSFLLEAQVGDVSRGTVERDLSVIDASGVLRGQCAAVRETGRVSQLVVRPVGPYARPALPDPLRHGTCL